MKGGSPCLHYTTEGGVMSIPDSEARKEWTKANTTVVTLKLNNNTDKDVLVKLDEVPSKQGYIKQLIRDDIADKEGVND